MRASTVMRLSTVMERVVRRIVRMFVRHVVRRLESMAASRQAIFPTRHPRRPSLW